MSNEGRIKTAKIGSRGNKQPRLPSSLHQQLVRQLRYLENSSNLFDAGDHDEANRIAVTLRVLLHDTGQSTSLLKLMGLKDNMQFVDTGLYRGRLDRAKDAYIEKNFPGARNGAISHGEAGLVELTGNSDGTGGWRAPLREKRFHVSDPKAAALLTEPQSFATWWKTPLAETSSGKQFSRENLVLIMANQDGGAHVDGELDRDYAEFCEDFLGAHVLLGGEEITDDTVLPPAQNSVPYASIRQIAFEVALTLRRHLNLD